MKIHVLPDVVINQISAGEVVERPASVVRELVDNAIDAGASEIIVHLQSGGSSEIQVNDNGSGMDRDDAVLAFERHATSKLLEAKDLRHITSLGFRGEALPSIAAVSKVRLRTRTCAAAGAVEVVVEGGVLKDVRTCAGPAGTQVSVRSLFFNTPARRKFLKQPAVEEQRVKSWLLRASLGWPQVHFRLFAEGREICNLPRRDTALERARSMLRGSTVAFDRQTGALRVSGVIAHPGLAQADLSAFAVLVNRRLITDRLIMRAVRDAFGSTLKPGEYPLGMLWLDLPPDEVDVNVHPQKSEVRFRSEGEVFAAVHGVIAGALRDFRVPLPGKDVRYGSGSSAAWHVRKSVIPEAVAEAGPAYAGEAMALNLDFTRDACERDPQPLDSFRFSDLRYIGQTLECYLLCEFKSCLYVIDMHAAHERYNYNIIRRRLEEGALISQMLLTPVVVDLMEAGLQNCLRHKDLLERFGFEIEAFGDQSLLVRAAPAQVEAKEIPALIKELAAADLKESAQGRVCERIDDMAARIACHASVRSGQLLSREEVRALFEKLDSADFRMACPHGRPVVVAFSAADMEKWFGRDR